MRKNEFTFPGLTKSTKGMDASVLMFAKDIIMPQCTMHCRHTIVRSFVSLSVCQILHISVSGGL